MTILTPAPLSRRSVPVELLTLGLRPRETGIVHLGLGNFHRAHQAVYTAAATRGADSTWGILGVANRSTTVVDALNAQDGLYSVLEVSPHHVATSVPGVHTGAIVAAPDPARVVEAMADERTRIISLTVTEHGYALSPGTKRLAVERADVAADLVNAVPRTTIGQVARSLETRARSHQRPVTVMSCDNLQGNGSLTRAVVLQFLESAGAGSDVVHWVGSQVSFPNSMVDRIVPATTDADRLTARRLTGFDDLCPVPTEPFTMWVVEDRFAAGRPPWERAGVTFSDEVASYELVKLRLLNGTHSLIAYLGALDGCATIPEARERDFVETAAHAVLHDDYLPSITLPDGFDIQRYIGSLFDRWSNHALGHRTQQVGSDGSVKLPQRVPDAALHRLRQGVVPEHLALTLAAWLCCVAPLDGFDPGAHARAMVDPARERLANLAASARGTADVVRSVFTRGQVFPEELADFHDFIDRITEYVAVITRDGVRAAAHEAARCRTPSHPPSATG